MIHINNISKSYSGKVFLKDASFTIGTGEKIGLIGRNGSGKSTLFKMIQNTESYDSGDIIIPKNYKIGSLDQHIQFNKKTVLEECTQVLSEEEQYDHYKAEKILFGLGFSKKDLHKDPNLFSGGYQVRISLTKALLKAPNLLMLDEPTNYLDIVSIRWLKGFLKNYHGEVIIITHDRSFMDHVVTHIVGIKRGQTQKIKGHTKKYYQQILEEEILHEQTRQNIDKKKKEIQSFVDKFRASATKASQAQSKLKQLEKMQSLDKLQDESQMNLHFPYEICNGKTLSSLENISFSYKKDSPFLFENLSFHIKPKDRIAIIGKNGKGKSTLLNIMARELQPSTGEIKSHAKLKIAHFGQTNINRLSLEETIANEIHSANSQLTTTQVRSIAGSMLFTNDDADKKIKVLSGGERSRVLLGKILANSSNLLLLDEPTNHLDMESIETLSEALLQYQGAMAIVTHNEMILKKIATKIILFRKNNAEVFHGSYDDFLEKIGWEDESLIKSKPIKEKLSYKEIKQKRSELIKERSKQTKPLKTSIEKLESIIGQAEEDLETQNNLLLKASETGDGVQIQKSSQEVNTLNLLIEDAFIKLEEQMEKLEEIETSFTKQLANFV